MKFAFASKAAGAFKPAVDAVKPLVAAAVATLLLSALEQSLQALYKGAKGAISERFGNAEPARSNGPGPMHARRSPLYDGEEGYECPHCGGPLDEFAEAVAADLHNGRRGEPVYDQRPGVHH